MGHSTVTVCSGTLLCLVPGVLRASRFVVPERSRDAELARGRLRRPPQGWPLRSEMERGRATREGGQQPERPSFSSPGGTPSLKVLWLSQEPGVEARRMDTLLACLDLSASREELQAVESPFQALCCLLTYLFVQVTCSRSRAAPHRRPSSSTRRRARGRSPGPVPTSPSSRAHWLFELC